MREDDYFRSVVFDLGDQDETELATVEADAVVEALRAVSERAGAIADELEPFLRAPRLYANADRPVYRVQRPDEIATLLGAVQLVVMSRDRASEGIRRLQHRLLSRRR